MKKLCLALFILLSFSCLPVSADCLFDGGTTKSSQNDGTKTPPPMTDNVSSVPVIVSYNGGVPPVVPHAPSMFYRHEIAVDVDQAAGQMVVVYGLGLGNGHIVVWNEFTGEIYRGEVSADEGQLIVQTPNLAGYWHLKIYLFDRVRGIVTVCFGDFIVE